MRGTVFKKSFFSLLCAALLSVPFLVFSQEVVSDAPAAKPQGYFIDNSKPKEDRVVQPAVSADQSYVITHIETEQSTETNDEATATETQPESVPESDLSSSTTEEPVEEQAVEPPSEPDVVEARRSEPEPTPQQVETPAPPQPQPKKEVAAPMRTFTKKIFVNKEAVHTCTAEVFTVDMSERSSAQNTLTLTKEADIAYEVEVGSLPAGIDVRFTDNGYYKNIGLEDDTVDFTITKERNAATGSFSIPIVYTQKGVFDSSVICQINVVNA